MRYTNLDVVIDETAPDQWTVTAEWRDGKGTGKGTGRLAIDRAQLDQDLDRLARGTVDEDFVREFGRRLFDYLFGGERIEILEQLNQCWGRTKGDRHHGIRIRLRLNSGASTVVPWEFLFWASQGDFVATDPAKSLVRQVESSGVAMVETTSALRMLIVAPFFVDLDSAREVRNLRSVLDPLTPRVEYEVLGIAPDGTQQPVYRDTVRQKLRESGPFHLFHYIGHGVQKDQGSFLLFNLPDEGASASDPAHGEGDFLDHEQFARVLRIDSGISLVVLNSCEGAKVSASNPFVGMAQQLIRIGVPAVVAMQYEIYDQVAIEFAESFYRTLVSQQHRGDVEAATALARNDLATDFPQTRALGTPALFLHGDHGILFDFDRGRIVADAPRSTNEVDRLRTVEEVKEKTISALVAEGPERNPEIAEQLESELAALKRIRARLRVGTAFALIPIAVALTVFGAHWFSAFDRSSLWFDSVTALVAESLDYSDSNETAVVAIAEEDMRERGAWGTEWRGRLGELVSKLADAGAAVVALDLYFNKMGDPADDASLHAAFSYAGNRGTPVVVGADSLHGTRPHIAESLEGEVEVASACGIAKPTAVLALLVQKPGRSPIPSLPLAAVLAFRSDTILEVDRRSAAIRVSSHGRDSAAPIRFASWERVRRTQANCSLIQPGDSIARLVIDYTYDDATEEPTRRFGYGDVASMDAAEAAEAFHDRIVVVGTTAEDKIPLYLGFGEQRYGFEIMASAIDTLVANRVIRRLAGGWLLLLLCLSAMLGAAIGRYPRTVRPSVRAAVLGMAIVLLLAVSALCYLAGLLVIFVYPMLALLLGYWGMRRAARWRLL